jgi:hypothetical protein
MLKQFQLWVWMLLQKTKTTTDREMIQLTMDCKKPSTGNELSLTGAIADLIHSYGLPFSLADEPKLARVIKLLRGVTSGMYQPPTHQDISSRLLKFNYQEFKKK